MIHNIQPDDCERVVENLKDPIIGAVLPWEAILRPNVFFFILKLEMLLDSNAIKIL